MPQSSLCAALVAAQDSHLPPAHNAPHTAAGPRRSAVGSDRGRSCPDAAPAASHAAESSGYSANEVPNGGRERHDDKLSSAASTSATPMGQPPPPGGHPPRTSKSPPPDAGHPARQ